MFSSLCLRILCCLYFCHNTFAKKTKADDLILYLPSVWPQPEFLQYSGYLNGVSDNIHLHYWLVEAAKSAATAPLILWLNGGPGCSSLEGLLSENGPYFVVDGPRLIPNSYSWNKVGNILYLEAPAGVGFSYADDGNVTTDDDFTSLNNYYALLNFLERFPEYKNRDFYITGESYAGVYIPTLALRVLQSNLLNLKGLAVGNGLTNYKMNDNSLLYFINYHGLVDENLWFNVSETCCASESKYRCMFTENNSTVCQQLVFAIANEAIDGLNIYNLYSSCAGGVKSHHLQNDDMDFIRKSKRLFSEPYVHSDFGNSLRDNIFMKARRKLSTKLREAFVSRLVLPCVNDTTIRQYLNTPLVRQFIHIKADQPSEWDVCSEKVSRSYGRTYKDLAPQYKKILESMIPILIYNGDIDMACNYLGDEWFLDELGYELTQPRKPWLYTEEDGTEQIGGYSKVFKYQGTPLIYTTVRGAGHMVPGDKPIPALQMLKQFLLNLN